MPNPQPVEPGEPVPPVNEMPKTTTPARMTRGTVQIGLPSAVIAVLALFNVIHWNTEQTTAVLALSYQAIMVLMNVTTWGRKIFAPDA
jgi:hypothetical protein